ncbi:MAG: HDOD domain-containing protein [Gammaproteobacteria bacterium]|nr:HDOD domain-containing protein [Gammaproteobacteria bacterium]
MEAKIGRYEVTKRIGRGSQGSVYLGRDPTLDRLVAVKVLTAGDAALNMVDADGTSLEARISSKLKHPNIVPIYDAGECMAGPYLIFEYVEGQPLSEVLKSRGAMSIEDAVPMIAAILKALSTAHAAEILHLDLSPRNVLIDADNVPRVMDFGLAQYVSIAREPKEFASGTLRYMAPEHFSSDPIGPWTDVFALGSTFYELVTGMVAMQGTKLEQIRDQIKSGAMNFEPVKALPHGNAFARFLAGAMEKSREGRYADCSTMSEAFDLFLEETGLAGKANTEGSSHSTIDFLLRRMQRTGDFPSISRTLSDINRLTGDEKEANADKLANVVLRDFALTGKLLKLVNSAFYGSRATEITSVSQAVVFLGVEQVRMTANSLAFFGHMKSDSAILKDSMTRSFLSGLIARALAQRAKLPGAEEAFISGMCQNLGENLVIFYFADEHEDIEDLQRREGLDKSAAARGVLGVGYSEVGAAVAKTWNLPRSIIEAIRGVPPGALAVPKSDDEKVRDVAVFANELCALFQYREQAEINDALDELLKRYENSVGLERTFCQKLVFAVFDKLKQFAPIFEINVASNGFCRAVNAWLEAQAESGEAEAAAPKVVAS